MRLKAKSAYDNADVAAVWRNIGDHITADEAATAVDLAVAEVKQVCAGNLNDVVYGWSGGKDSTALQVIMERAGIHRAVIGTVSQLEFRQYLTWIDGHRPDGLEVIDNPGLTLAWLARPENLRYLFPRNANDGYFWALSGTRRAQLRYQQTHKPVLQIYGRRTMDGNYIGPDGYGIQRTKRLTTYCPMRAWSHELTLAVVYYAGKPLPPTYDWPHGWTAGTGPWPGRRVGTPAEAWAETFAIEPDRVRDAAQHIQSARDWLADAGVS